MGVNLMACTKQIGHSCGQILDECRFHSLPPSDENISFLRLIIVEIIPTFLSLDWTEKKNYLPRVIDFFDS